jgi:hypothetical protein
MVNREQCACRYESDSVKTPKEPTHCGGWRKCASHAKDCPDNKPARHKQPRTLIAHLLLLPLNREVEGPPRGGQAAGRRAPRCTHDATQTRKTQHIEPIVADAIDEC